MFTQLLEFITQLLLLTNKTINQRQHIYVNRKNNQ